MHGSSQRGKQSIEISSENEANFFFTNHTEMAFAEEEEKNKDWFQPKAEPEKINWYSPTGRLDFH